MSEEGGGAELNGDFTPGHPVRRNLAVLAGGQVTTWTMSMLWTLVVPRVLGPAGLGLITSVWAAAGILGILLGLGTENYLARELVAKPASAGSLVGTSLVLRLVMAPVFAGGAVAFVYFAHYGAEARLVMWLAAGATLFTLMDDPFLATFESRERMEYMAYSDVINKSAQGLIGILVVVVGFGAVGLTASWLVVSISVLVLGFRWIKPMVNIELRTTARQLAGLVRASVPYFASGVFYLIYLWIDSIMLQLMTRNEVVGWYAVPTQLMGAAVFVPVIVSTAWAPRLVRTFEGAEADLSTVAQAPIELVLVLSFPLCAATVLCAQPFIPLLYGSAYKNSVPVMQILGLTLIPMYANIIFAQVLVSMRRQSRLTWLMAGASLVNPALNFFFIRLTDRRYHNGAIGAAICMLVTELLIVAADLVFLGGRRFLSLSSLLRVLRAALASAGMWLAGYLASPLGWYVSLPLAGLTFLALAWILRLAGPLEKEALRAGMAKVTTRARRPRG